MQSLFAGRYLSDRIIAVLSHIVNLKCAYLLLRSQLNVKSVILSQKKFSLSKEFFSLDRNFSPPKGPFCLRGEFFCV